MPLRTSRGLAVALLILAALPLVADAASIRKCTMSDGRVTYSDGGCSAASRTSRAYVPPPSAIGSGPQGRERQRAYNQFSRRERDRDARAALPHGPGPGGPPPRERR